MASGLVLRDVDAGYGERTVIRSLHAQFPWGRITAVLGPGGSGKSTLLEVLEGRSSRAPESLLWSTGDVPSLDAWRLPQRSREDDDLADLAWAERTLEGWARRAGLSTSIMRHALWTDPGLLARLGRVMDARAEVLLLDEPDASAGRSGLAALAVVLRRLSFEGRTIIFVTHDLRLACRVADHVLLIIDGDKLDEGPPARVQAQPSCSRVRDFFTWGG